MLSMFRKIAVQLPIIKSAITACPPSSQFLSPFLMDSSSSSSQRLLALAEQLRRYKPPPPVDGEPEDIEPHTNKLITQVGFAESSTPIAQNLKKERENQEEWFKRKRAAVLVCLFEGDGGDLRVILTKRSSKLSTHSGEVALPGGKVEEGDKDEAETATREAKEEIGLDPSLVNVVTVLEPFLSKHLLRVVPVIGILTNKEAFKPDPNTDEVEVIFDAPLEMFIKDENRRVQETEWMGSNYLVHFFDYETNNEKYLIWGLTAAILIKAASVVYQRAPPFVEQNPLMKVPSVVDKDTLMR
ncbi:Nudix hydrolase 15, mitochondrial [Ancistrocladus abbreviatus]